jgi:hypothetical protein
LARLGIHARRPWRRPSGLVLSRIGLALWAALSWWSRPKSGGSSPPPECDNVLYHIRFSAGGGYEMNWVEVGLAITSAAGLIAGAVLLHGWITRPEPAASYSLAAAELHRVFPPAVAADRAADCGATGDETLQAQIDGLRQVSELLRAQLDDVRADRDAWRDQAQAGQRLLAPPERPPRRVPWWRRLAG